MSGSSLAAGAQPTQRCGRAHVASGRCAVLPALQKVMTEGVHPVAMSNARITDEWASRDGKVEVKSHGHEVGFPWYGQVCR